jgi:hypothetical protein
VRVSSSRLLRRLEYCGQVRQRYNPGLFGTGTGASIEVFRISSAVRPPINVNWLTKGELKNRPNSFAARASPPAGVRNLSAWRYFRRRRSGMPVALRNSARPPRFSGGQSGSSSYLRLIGLRSYAMAWACVSVQGQLTLSVNSMSGPASSRAAWIAKISIS